MSLEHFLKSHRPNQDTVDALAKEKRNKEILEPLQIYFARKMMSAAHDSLVEKSDKVVSVIGMTEDVHDMLVRSARFELDTIFFTAAVISLQECMVEDGTFSVNSYNDLVNTALLNTGIKPFPKSDVPDEVVEAEKMKKIVKQADVDPTLSFFFKTPYEFIPTSLKKDLKGSLQNIEKGILPWYERVAAVLVQSERSVQAKRGPYTPDFSLLKIDEIIGRFDNYLRVKREEDQKRRQVPKAFEDAFAEIPGGSTKQKT